MATAKTRLRPPKRLAPGKPELTYGWQQFADIARELPPLFERHHQEVSSPPLLPLDLDWDRFFDMALMGVLRCLTVRSEGALVGYVFVCVHPSQNHREVLSGIYERYWLDPAWRQGRTGIQMFEEAEKMLDKSGVRLRYINENFRATNGRLGALLKRFGYAPIEQVYLKLKD